MTVQQARDTLRESGMPLRLAVGGDAHPEAKYRIYAMDRPRGQVDDRLINWCRSAKALRAKVDAAIAHMRIVGVRG